MRNVTRGKVIAIVVMVLLIGGMFTGIMVRPARAINASDILKVGGVLLATSQFSDSINNFINGLLKERKNEAMAATKVVPIVSVGQGAYIGAAQVVGVPGDVQRVQAVASVEGTLSRLQGTLLVPISTKIPGKSLAKVNGIGVSAIIDLKL
ncbi:MAG TPA: hypothetical protein VHV83_10405 [Armatimonadota bacterium]|nr:hypothetical protein [Armatimonadota bacterium]